jgi:hypothetical protein
LAYVLVILAPMLFLLRRRHISTLLDVVIQILRETRMNPVPNIEPAIAVGNPEAVSGDDTAV